MYPFFEKYAGADRRMLSFGGDKDKILVQKAVDSGFFLSDADIDMIRCFCCGTSLEKYNSETDFDELHYLESCFCPFLILSRKLSSTHARLLNRIKKQEGFKQSFPVYKTCVNNAIFDFVSKSIYSSCSLPEKNMMERCEMGRAKMFSLLMQHAGPENLALAAGEEKLYAKKIIENGFYIYDISSLNIICYCRIDGPNLLELRYSANGMHPFAMICRNNIRFKSARVAKMIRSGNGLRPKFVEASFIVKRRRAEKMLLEFLRRAVYLPELQVKKKTFRRSRLLLQQKGSVGHK
jgi:hypothetical protein